MNGRFMELQQPKFLFSPKAAIRGQPLLANRRCRNKNKSHRFADVQGAGINVGYGASSSESRLSPVRLLKPVTFLSSSRKRIDRRFRPRRGPAVGWMK
jgi:hypothetical protein